MDWSNKIFFIEAKASWRVLQGAFFVYEPHPLKVCSFVRIGQIGYSRKLVSPVCRVTKIRSSEEGFEALQNVEKQKNTDGQVFIPRPGFAIWKRGYHGSFRKSQVWNSGDGSDAR